MTVAVVLLGYAAVLAVCGPRLLGAPAWMEHAPRLGIVAWQAASVSFLASLVLGGLALSVPTVQVSANLAEVLRACVLALRSQYATPGGAAAGAVGATLALGVFVRCAYSVAATMASAVVARCRHRSTLRLVGRPGPASGVIVLDHPAPAAYCVPGLRRIAGGHVVLTSAAVGALDGPQLRAVLAHERAHLRAHHDLVTAAAAGLAAAFPRLRLFQAARAHILRLIELAADDAAARSEHRLTVAEALLAVASGPRPAGSLGAGGSADADRVRRLIAGRRPLGRASAALSGLAVALILAGPLLIFAGPAMSTLNTACC
ncbi:MAG: M48 family metalloprotease [Streptosporangiales bacterium]|nr:M48 family metalloprotease [Streptosporangiales bacterium]